MIEFTAENWEDIIEKAIKSGQKIDEWCVDQQIHKSTFYRHCRALGFIKNGSRTDKWKACCPKMDKTFVESEPVLVPVPLETISAVPGTVPGITEDNRPSICIQSGSLKIFVGDGFQRETLRDVLEVVLIAQES